MLTGPETLIYIPLEDNGSIGTRYVHPEEGFLDAFSTNDRTYDSIIHPGLGSELMTGIATQDANEEFSKITIGFAEDIGYSVDYNQADPYTIP